MSDGRRPPYRTIRHEARNLRDARLIPPSVRNHTRPNRVVLGQKRPLNAVGFCAIYLGAPPAPSVVA